MRRLVGKMAEGCGWTTLASIRADRAAAWLLDIKRNGVPDKDGVRKARLPSDRTVNQYLESTRAFLKWCVASGYLPEDPLASVEEGTKTEAGEAPSGLLSRRAPGPAQRRRHPRARVPDRRVTGLRKDELRQLQWRDCRLEQAMPCIELRPEANKSRRQDRVPLNVGAAAELAALRPGKWDPLGPVFPSIPTLETLQRDLEKARHPLPRCRGPPGRLPRTTLYLLHVPRPGQRADPHRDGADALTGDRASPPDLHRRRPARPGRSRLTIARPLVLTPLPPICAAPPLQHPCSRMLILTLNSEQPGLFSALRKQ